MLTSCPTPLDAIVGSRIKSGAAQRRGTPTHLAGRSLAAKRTRRTRANINYESKALINADNVGPRANHFGHRGPPCRAPRGPAVHRTACVGEGQGRPRDGGGRRSAVGARVPPHAGGHRGQSAPPTPVKVLGRARERPTAPREGAKGPPLRCTTNFGRFSGIGPIQRGRSCRATGHPRRCSFVVALGKAAKRPSSPVVVRSLPEQRKQGNRRAVRRRGPAQIADYDGISLTTYVTNDGSSTVLLFRQLKTCRSRRVAYIL